jgi:hypothetical protein
LRARPGDGRRLATQILTTWRIVRLEQSTVRAHRKISAKLLEVFNLEVNHGAIYCMAQERNLYRIAVCHSKRPAEFISAFLLAPGNMSQRVSMCLNMPQHASICLNMPQPAQRQPRNAGGGCVRPGEGERMGDFLKTRSSAVHLFTTTRPVFILDF